MPMPLGALADRLDPRVRAGLFALAALAIFLLGMFAARFRARRVADGATAAPAVAAQPTQRSLERALRRACSRRDVVAAEAAVRALRRLLATDVARFADPTLAQEIARLHAVRYSTQGEAWSGAALWKAWRRSRKTRRPKHPSEGLPPLYPAP
jgi:hypothetical protein